MNKKSPYLIIIIILFAFILLQNSLVILIGNIGSLFREDNRLVLMEKSYTEKIERLEIALSEYEKSLSNLKIVPSSSNVLAKISLRDIYDFYNFLIISTDSMVYEGNAVMNENGLVGVIESSSKSTAKVKLLTGKNSISVKVASSYGQLDEYNKETGLFLIHNINNYEVINIGDEVVTSGLSTLDKGLYVGKVKKIEKKGIEQLVYVESQVDFDNLNYLYVISKK